MLPKLDADRALFIRSSGDEATGALASMQFAGWLMSRPWILLNNRVGRLDLRVNRWRESLQQGLRESLRWKIGVGLCTIAFGLGVFMLKGSLRTQTFGIALMVPFGTLLFVRLAPVYIVSYAYFVLALLLIPLLIISAIILLPFAPEATLASPFMDIKIEATPPGTWTISHLEALSHDVDGTSVVGRGLAHSETYTDPRSLTLIVEWMQSRLPSSVRDAFRTAEPLK